MTHRKIRPKEEATDTTIPSVESELTAEQVAAYLRQSTTRQTIENLESKELQLTGAQRFAVSQGLDADKIVVQWEGEGKRGVSGTKRIDQRERLSDIMDGIRQGKIKIVWAYSVSRLFRDKFGVQVGTFIEACAEHGVRVVIGQMTFDFSNYMYVMMFQMLASQAAQENELRSKLMSEGRSNKAKRGGYDGRPIIAGYIVDRKDKSETYGMYVQYEPHAEVVRWLYRRYRELDGRFNVLARDVARMPVLFPDFDKSVDKRNVHRLLLKKVPGGYHITKKTLFNLMTSVEYAGYWRYDNGVVRTDEQGKPIQNHEPVVPMDDWKYAFYRLSFVSLDGTENRQRVSTRTWVPSVSKGKNNEPKMLLHGLLTSPLGTVQYSKEYTRGSSSGGTYCVAEQRQGRPERSITLVVNAQDVHNLFLNRLYTRYYEMDEVTDEERKRGFYRWDESRPNAYEKIMTELTRVKANNEKALMDVPSQIEGYQKIIAAKQTILAALGGDADVETAIMLNNEIKEARTHIQELEEMRDSASVEEEKLLKLSEQISAVGLGRLKDKEMLRRFIILATDRIELNEYSNHFATLTVTWSKPFQQVDVGYIFLPSGVREPWSEQDNADLKTLYPYASRLEIMQRFPTRSWMGVQGRAFNKGVTREIRDKDNNREISDRSLSLRDWEVMQEFGISTLKGCAEVPLWYTNVDNVLGNGSGEVTHGNRRYNGFISLDTCTAAGSARFAG